MEEVSISSPDKTIIIKFNIKNDSKKGKIPIYSVFYKEFNIIGESILGLNLKTKSRRTNDFLKGWKIKEVNKESHQEKWKPTYGERDSIPNNYNELIIKLVNDKFGKEKALNIIFRVFNEGFAFRYQIPKQEYIHNFIIKDEITQFNLPSDSWCYEEHGSEGKYHFKPVSSISLFTERPLTIVINKESSSEKFLVITDANVINYPAIRLVKDKNKENICILRVKLGATDKILYPGETIFRPKNIFDKWDGKVEGQTPFETPWKVVIIGEKPGDLIEQNYIIYNLCEKSQIKDITWIKPGKVIRDMLMSTKSSKEYVDFAVKYGIDYVHWDAGWYGPEGDVKSDPTTITLDPKKLGSFHSMDGHTGLDFHATIKYAKDNGIGVWVYVNRRHLELHLDEILPLYKKWGIDGIKFGFVKYGPQKCMKWLIDAVKKCAEYKIMVDIHDSYRPSGLSRTYPNLLTQEGIRGNEHRPTPTHNCTVPFTRFCSGAADYTISYYSNKIQTTHTHQIALSIIYYSPLQFLFWYDNPSHCNDEPELVFFKNLPTTWDDTIIIDGKIGEYITIARKSGDIWYLGAITNETDRSKNIKLLFLDKDKEYSCKMYFDDDNVNTTTKVGMKDFIAKSSDEIDHKIIGSGGMALIFEPIKS